jgi:limonene-1,2-epoxide hydrolase
MGSGMMLKGHEIDAREIDAHKGPLMVVMEAMDAVGRQDIEGILKTMADDIVYQNTGLPTAVGKKAVREVVSGISQILSSTKVYVQNVVSSHRSGFGAVPDFHHVVVERVEFYTVSLDAPSPAKGGATLALPVVGWFVVSGKEPLIVRWSDYWDNRMFIEALGIPLPTP